MPTFPNLTQVGAVRNTVNRSMDEKPTQFTDVAEIYDNLMSVVPYPWWVEYVQRLWKSFDHEPRRVLDLACGTGNVTRELLKRGYEVTGVDNSPPMLEVARRKLPESVPLLCQDARHLSVDGPPFDAVVCLFDSLNYLLELPDLHRAFRAVHRRLVPGGPFVFDMTPSEPWKPGCSISAARAETPTSRTSGTAPGIRSAGSALSAWSSTGA